MGNHSLFNINLLPNLLLDEVFKYLSFEEKSGLRSVCREWDGIITATLLKNVRCFPQDKNWGSFCSLISRFGYLVKSMEFKPKVFHINSEEIGFVFPYDDFALDSATSEFIYTNCPSIESLVVTVKGECYAMLLEIGELSQNLPRLRCLDFKGSLNFELNDKVYFFMERLCIYIFENNTNLINSILCPNLKVLYLTSYEKTPELADNAFHIFAKLEIIKFKTFEPEGREYLFTIDKKPGNITYFNFSCPVYNIQCDLSLGEIQSIKDESAKCSDNIHTFINAFQTRDFAQNLTFLRPIKKAKFVIDDYSNSWAQELLLALKDAESISIQDHANRIEFPHFQMKAKFISLENYSESYASNYLAWISNYNQLLEELELGFRKKVQIQDGLYFPNLKIIWSHSSYNMNFWDAIIKASPKLTTVHVLKYLDSDALVARYPHIRFKKIEESRAYLYPKGYF